MSRRRQNGGTERASSRRAGRLDGSAYLYLLVGAPVSFGAVQSV